MAFLYKFEHKLVCATKNNDIGIKINRKMGLSMFLLIFCYLPSAIAVISNLPKSETGLVHFKSRYL